MKVKQAVGAEGQASQHLNDICTDAEQLEVVHHGWLQGLRGYASTTLGGDAQTDQKHKKQTLLDDQKLFELTDHVRCCNYFIVCCPHNVGSLAGM